MYALPTNVFEPQLSPRDFERIRALVGDRLGIRIETQEFERFGSEIITQMRQFACLTSTDYCQLLTARPTHSPYWQPLIAAITNTESFFFRDQGQFGLLRTHILPELIQRRSPQKQLNIWSVGCSTGEEAYSLAILLTELIPDLEQWEINIWGTDINWDALKIAQQGKYYGWSFRGLDCEYQQQYFDQLETAQFCVKPQLRQLVQFQHVNLLEEGIPTKFAPADLILCRHVCIHLKAQAIAKLLNKFHQTLPPDGYLMTGHAELYGQNLSHFQTLVFPTSRIYQPKQLQLEQQHKVKVHLPLLPQLEHQGDRASRLHLSHPIFEP
jgi:chemotaxis protein methyltransferase CheR